MSRRYKGAVLSATPPTTSTSSASGVWTEQQFMQGVATGSWPALAGAPTIGTATAGALNASVAFTAPTYTGSGITGYTVTSSPGGITGTGASSPITVSGLTAGTAYTFTVTATTAAGQGPASAASNSVTPTAPQYIEDVFSTYLYTGNSSTQTITNGIDLATYGGMVWEKGRSSAQFNGVVDSARGVANCLVTSSTGAQNTVAATGISAFNTNGFAQKSNGDFNTSGETYVSWTFRKQAKFFDVVTYTGTGSVQNIAHSLGAVPGCMIVKGTTQASAGNWNVYHTSIGSSNRLLLNSTVASAAAATTWNNTDPTSTQFTVGTSSQINASGESYVAYLFASNAGGFGTSGSDNVISCGSVSYSGATSVNLGYEPQWILWRKSSGVDDWWMFDTMRGLVVDNGSGTGDKVLYADLTNAETGTYGIDPTATGFNLSAGWSAGDYIYIAIRRGPMKVPTVGTTVFSPQIWTGNGTSRTITGTNNPVDLSILTKRDASGDRLWNDRLRGAQQTIYSNYAQAEVTQSNYVSSLAVQSGITIGTAAAVNGSGNLYVSEMLSRAPVFFDEVCYAGTGSNLTQNHNLTVAPTLIIIKNRTNGWDWNVGWNFGASTYSFLTLSNTNPSTDNAYSSHYTAAPTATQFFLATNIRVNQSGADFVAYLFATCAGVSKVGTYTGTAATQTIDCGFTTGARFVLIKQTSGSGGDWYYWDSARGMVSGTDPRLQLNDSVSETNTDYVTTTSVGFQVVTTSSNINASGGTYLFLAIA